PHLVIRCHPDLADAVRDTATNHMAHSGFSGRLVVMGDPDIRIGDGRVEWVDGGIVRDIAATAGEIDRQIASYRAAYGRDADTEACERSVAVSLATLLPRPAKSTARLRPCALPMGAMLKPGRAADVRSRECPGRH